MIGVDGITVDLNGHTISGQLVTGPNPTEVGIDNPGHDGVTIRNGTVTSFALGGVRPAAFEERAGIDIFGDRMAVAANLVSETYLSDGIRVEPEAAGTLLQAYVSSRNGADGIDVESSATNVTANVANDNGELGIEAVPGVTDGGGNHARGNGDPAQCVGVSCS